MGRIRKRVESVGCCNNRLDLQNAEHGNLRRRNSVLFVVGGQWIFWLSRLSEPVRHLHIILSAWARGKEVDFL